MKNWFSRLVGARHVAGLFALLGGGVYLAQSFLFAHGEETNFDEGLYLLKGFLFATGVYEPFQPYGVLTNKPPLAFLIPGYVQVIFGTGLRTGRYLSIFFSLLALVGLWIVARRLGSKWLAAGAVWAFAVSPVIIGIYSLAITQVVVNCILIWMLVLALGEKRPLWQLIVSGVLAGLVTFTRYNVIAVVPLLGLYILWQHGYKAAILSMLAAGVVLITGVAIYWPDILSLFTTALPGRLAPFLDPYRYPDLGEPFWNPSIAWDGRVLAFFQALRLEFLPLAGSLIALLMWPVRSKWYKSAPYRSAVFLGVLYTSLLLMHFWASILNNYCVFCFLAYLAFFNSVGILLVVILIQSWERNPGPIRQLALVLFVAIIFTGIGFSLFEEIGNKLVAMDIPNYLVGNRPITVWEILSGKFSFERKLAKQVASTFSGLVLGIVFLCVSFLLYKFWKKKIKNFGFALANAVLAFGFLFSWLLAGSNRANQCNLDVIAAYEENGAHLARIIPPGSLVYWDGGLSVIPLLYIPGVRIFPSQLNQDYAFRIGGDPDSLRKAGLWNEALAQQWKNEADFLLIEESRYNEWKGFLETGNRFDEFPRVPQPVSCQDGSRVRIFKRKP